MLSPSNEEIFQLRLGIKPEIHRPDHFTQLTQWVFATSFVTYRDNANGVCDRVTFVTLTVLCDTEHNRYYTVPSSANQKPAWGAADQSEARRLSSPGQ